MSEKLTKRELRSPDQLQESGAKAVDYARAHPREIGIAIAGLVLALVIIGLLASGGAEKKGPEATPAGKDLSAALAILTREIVAPGGAGGAAPDTYPTEEARTEAAAVALEKVRADHAGTDAAASATLTLGDLRLQQGRPEVAAQLYEEYLQKAAADAPMRPLGLLGRATALEEKGDLEGAVKAFEQVGTDAPSYEDRALYGKGRVLEKLGKLPEAKAAYEQLKEKHASTAAGRLGVERLKLVDVVAPAPSAGGTGG